MPGRLDSVIANATKWSATSEIVSKLISPITSMVLAHLLAPEIFGVVTSLALVTSFQNCLQMQVFINISYNMSLMMKKIVFKVPMWHFGLISFCPC